jgi:hypothetical protein
MALPNSGALVPFFALVVFDVGMLAWSYVFINYAEGTAQRAIAIIMTVIDFAGVGLMVVAEVLLNGQSFTTAPEYLGAVAVWGIAIWTILNVGASISFHVASPDAQKKMAIQTEKDAIFADALKQLAQKRANISATVADKMSGDMMSVLLAELSSDQNGDGVPDIMQVSEQVAIMAKDAPPAPAVRKVEQDDGANFTQPPTTTP